MTRSHIDWSQVWYPGPRQAFSAEQMARAGADGPSATLVVSVALNLAVIAFVLLQFAPATHTAFLAATLAALVVLGYGAARWLWWRPWRRPLMQASLVVMFSVVALAHLVRWRWPGPDDPLTLALVLAVGCVILIMMLWFLVQWRAHQIGARLRELDEREMAVEMARRLAAAQIEPHFLFNTLASLQHWVQTQDPRAASLLTSLTGYLRATLPLFERAQLAAGDELVAIEHYLQVMQARLGAERLQWRIDVDAAACRASLPPGLLLTLVENAIVHGIEPQLAGGRVIVSARREGETVIFEVDDNGAGPVDEAPDGVGLANVRQRLALAAGAAGRLSLRHGADGGCRAAIQLPYRETP